MMNELGSDFKIDIAMQSNGTGQLNVVLTLPAGQCPTVELSTKQARTLANEIIKAVNKAEVRANLRSQNNLRRSEADTHNNGKKNLPYLVHS